MIAELIQQLRDLFRRADRVEPFDLKYFDPEEADAFFYQEQGQLWQYPLPPTRRDHKVYTLESFFKALDRYDPDYNASIWVSMKEVKALLEKGGDTELSYVRRFASLTMPITVHPAFDFLVPHRDSPSSLVSDLQFRFNDCNLIPDPLPALREIRFERGSSEEVKAYPDDEAVSTSVSKKIQCIERLPDSVNVWFAPFPDLAERFESRVCVEFSMQPVLSEGLIDFRPFPGRPERARAIAMEMLARVISETYTRYVAVGTP